jgi:hypothetical protein
MKLRVWNVINPPREPFFFDVESIEQALRQINFLVEQQLYNHRIKSNVFGLEVLDETSNEWVEWYDDEDNCINDYELIDNKAVLKQFL